MCDYCCSYEMVGKKDILFQDFDIKVEDTFSVGKEGNTVSFSGTYVYEDVFRATVAVGDDGLWLGIWSVSLDEHGNLPIDLDAKVKIKYCPMCGRKLGGNNA